MMPEIRQSSFNSFAVQAGNERAEILWRITAAGGVRLVIFSSFGDWSNYWSHPGDNQLAFLAGICRDYTGSKIFGSNYNKDDAETFREHALRHVIEYRRQGYYDKEFARTEYDCIQEVEHVIDMGRFYDNTQIQDAWEINHTKPDNSWCCFWNQIWLPHVRPVFSELSTAVTAA